MFCLLDTINDWGRVCRAIGRPELIGDFCYATVEVCSRHSEEVVVLLDKAIGARDMVEWDVIFR